MIRTVTNVDVSSSHKKEATTVVPKKRKRQIVESDSSGFSGSDDEDSEPEKIVKHKSSSRAVEIETPQFDPYAKKEKVTPPKQEANGAIASHREVKMAEKLEKKTLTAFFSQAKAPEPETIAPKVTKT